MTPQYKFSLLNTTEATYYLEVSRFKFKKLIQEGFLNPQIWTIRSGKELRLFDPLELTKVKKMLKKEGYRYQNA
ncbi:hypothetical protein Desaci_0398 [Desulfosporosinus acidiphilus SJ4]|uniref:Uncharacterized protein n=1 Tax=Desulfosporosinus acidiphilus (strain DSM 22704 / JCM 16185 / SJ4) TaxID=646529 RepID=I4D0Z1_DESAJ|nr:hypothetical protein [Desulfosporosinus acidiphilus]AFM39465.1 hypothetical protein Desaci_0398 [Desulfosporosinus acidiphilus SJ4]